MHTKMEIKVNLKELRKDKFTQQYVADYLGMTASNYRRLEYGQSQSYKKSDLEKLCKLFECGVEDILKLS